MYEDERIKALLAAMRDGSPGSPLMGGLKGGMGRVVGAPGAAASFIRGGIGNRGSGRGALAFSPYAAQVAQGKANLQAPTRPPDGGFLPPGNGTPPPFYGGNPGNGNGQGPPGGGSTGPDAGGVSYAAPTAPTSPGIDPYTGEPADANTIRRLLGLLGRY